MAITIDELQVEIEASSQKTASEIDNLVAALGRLKKMSTGGLGLDKVRKQIDGMRTSASAKAAKSATSTSAQKPVDKNIFPEDSVGRYVEDNVESLTRKYSPALDAIKSAFSSAGSAAKGIFARSIDIAKSALGGLGRAAKSAAKSLGGLALSGLKSLGSNILHSVTNPIKNAKDHIDKFMSSLRRILMYRAIRFLFKKITSGIKDGIDNLAQYSKALNGLDASHANKTMSELTTITLQLKNSIGAALMPILTALVPVIQAVANGFMNAVNAVNQFFSAVTGAATFTRATSVAQDYAASLDSATSSANALKNATLGIDELNVISPNSGTGAAAKPADMFQKATIGSGIKSLVEQIKAAYASGDWAGIGELLGGKVNSAIDSIDFDGAGKKIGTKLKHAFEAAYGFLSTVDFDKIGSGVAKFLNGSIDKSDFKLIGKTLAKKVTIAVDFLYGFVTDFDWSGFGTAVSDAVNGWFGEIDWAKAGQAISRGIIGLLDAAKAFFQNTDWQSIGNDIGTFISSIDWSGIFQNVMYVVGQALGAAILLLKGAIKNAWSAVVNWWHEVAFEDGKFTIEGLLGGIWDKMKDIAGWIKTNIINPLVGGVKSMLGIHSPSTVFMDIGSNIIEGLLDGIKNTWHKITDHLTSKWNDLKSWWSGLSLSSIKIPVNSIKSQKTQYYASGGWPDTGDVFVANESGPEMVGRIGSRTAVANSDQIVTAIRAGVYDAVTAAMGSGSGSGASSYKFEMDGREVATRVTKRQGSSGRMYGRQLA